MAREKKTVTLKRPFGDGKGGIVNEITLQEPIPSDFFSFGPPQTWVKVAGGMALSDNDVAIRSYVERMIVEPDPLIAMTQMSLLDAIAVRECALSFFQDSAPTQSE